MCVVNPCLPSVRGRAPRTLLYHGAAAVGFLRLFVEELRLRAELAAALHQVLELFPALEHAVGGVVPHDGGVGGPGCETAGQKRAFPGGPKKRTCRWCCAARLESRRGF